MCIRNAYVSVAVIVPAVTSRYHGTRDFARFITVGEISKFTRNKRRLRHIHVIVRRTRYVTCLAMLCVPQATYVASVEGSLVNDDETTKDLEGSIRYLINVYVQIASTFLRCIETHPWKSTAWHPRRSQFCNHCYKDPRLSNIYPLVLVPRWHHFLCWALYSFQFFSVILFQTNAALYRNFSCIGFILCFYVGMPGSCCYIIWESKGKLYQNTCWRFWRPECSGSYSYTSLSYSVRTGHWVPLSQPPPYSTAPLAVVHNCWQLIEFLGGRLRGALSSTIYIKTDLKGTMG
jgi:hypothetical protein